MRTLALATMLIASTSASAGIQYNIIGGSPIAPSSHSYSVETKIQPRIISGYTIEDNSHSYFAELEIRESNGQSWQCGATRVAHDYAVTAAHCIVNGATYTLKFRNVTVTATPIVHSEWNTTTLKNDIAMLHMNQSPSLSQVAILPIASTDETNTAMWNQSYATVIGSGVTESGSLSSTIRSVDVPMMTNDACNSPSNYFGNVQPGMICAGTSYNGLNNNPDSCQGDSGGPLVLNNTLVGIVSWGEGCGEKPGVYTRTSYHLGKFLSGYGVTSAVDSTKAVDNAEGGAGSLGFGLSIIGLIGLVRRKIN